MVSPKSSSNTELVAPKLAPLPFKPVVDVGLIPNVLGVPGVVPADGVVPGGDPVDGVVPALLQDSQNKRTIKTCFILSQPWSLIKCST